MNALLAALLQCSVLGLFDFLYFYFQIEALPNSIGIAGYSLNAREKCKAFYISNVNRKA